MENEVQVGARIVFSRSIYEPACGDHPEFILCRKGEQGTVTGPQTSCGYLVRWDAWPSADFRCLRTEFEVLHGK